MRDQFDHDRFDALQSFLLVETVAHSGMLLGNTGILGWYVRSAFAPALLLSCLVGLSSRRAKPYCVIASFVVMSAWISLAWPTFANHLALEWSVLLFLILCRSDEKLGLNAIRWLAAIVLFHTGLQKLVMGQYFGGEFLSYAVATSAKFREFFAFVLSDAEVGRLVVMGGRTGTGPYTTPSLILLVMSNCVWIAEIGFGALLLVPRYRKFALVGAIGLVLGIELGAREVIFGCLFGFLLLMFSEGKKASAYWPALSGLQILTTASHYLLPGLKIN